MNVSQDQLERAMARFEQENAHDPNVEQVGNERVPRELAYARRLSEWVLRLDPQASPALRLAAHCQHIRRWEVPRSQFPADRSGYHRWKNFLKKYHAEASGKILRECGCSEELIDRVQALNLKSQFPQDPESQTMEDALCLVFLQNQFKDLADRTEEEKVINAVRKSWMKMSPRARELAGTLNFSDREKAILKLALEN